MITGKTQVQIFNKRLTSVKPEGNPDRGIHVHKIQVKHGKVQIQADFSNERLPKNHSQKQSKVKQQGIQWCEGTTSRKTQIILHYN